MHKNTYLLSFRLSRFRRAQFKVAGAFTHGVFSAHAGMNRRIAGDRQNSQTGVKDRFMGSRLKFRSICLVEMDNMSHFLILKNITY
ncbi:MAG: hypothetical protein CMM40_07815 [Rhodospirillaceae bacterium]|nr:hypothetical protein [Rhodospirillaceae bacterium]